MRWDRLFTDLEAEAAELHARDRDAEISALTEVELAQVSWLERLRGAVGWTIGLEVGVNAPVRGRLRYVGADWVLLDDNGWDVLVPAQAVAGIEGVGRSAAASAERVPLTWAAAWRTLCRDRSMVRVARADGTIVRGRVARVGADFAEIDRAADGGVQAPPSRDQRRSAMLVVPFACVRVVHALPDGML